ncbi:MAG: hypothetical protein AAGA99_01320 [Actinomycetota bacterium]
MRNQILAASVARLLPRGSELTEVAVMWQRHRYMFPFGAFAALIVGSGAGLVGFSLSSSVGLAAAAAAVAATATTEYRVLAWTTDRLHLLRGSRFRRAAVEYLEALPDRTPVELVGNQFVITEWRVGDHRFTVPKSSESAMTRIATGRAAE